MGTAISLRRASMDDGDLLLEWRNDPLTRAASHTTSEITREEHQKWLKESLAHPNRQLYIAEEYGIPVGIVRADFDSTDHSTKLSWTVAPMARDRGVGKRMVALLADQIKGSVRAELKVGNVASARIAKGLGMQFEYEKDGVLFFRRPPVEDVRIHV